LWEFAKQNELFAFRTIEDVLEENRRLHAIIDEDLADLKKRMNNTEEQISRFSSNLTATNQRVDTNELSIDENKDSIEAIVESVSNLKEFPVGTILTWISRTSGAEETADLPDGWVRCDGGTIPHPSIWAGKYTPNLNGEKRFLRGGIDADQLKFEEDQIQDHLHEFNDPGHSHAYGDKWSNIGDRPIGAGVAAATPDKERKLSTRNQKVMNKELFIIIKQFMMPERQS